jgi:CheY-like chemotaxis protein
MPTSPDQKVDMSLHVVLVVGFDSWLLTLQASALKSAGYIVVSAVSIKEAIDHFRAGDFDLVLLGHSISLEHKQRLTFQIRKSGSTTPVACIADHPREYAAFADATLEDESSALLTGMGTLLEKDLKKWAAEPLTKVHKVHTAQASC